MMPPGFGTWLDGAPFWQIALALLIAMGVASLVGEAVSRPARKHSKAPTRDDADDGGDGDGYIVSATLGLLALLLGFTFSLAVDRFEARRQLVLEEANAIGTAYLRTQLLEPVDRARISGLLVAYTDNRLALASAAKDQTAPMVVRNDQLITDLWTATVAAFPSIKGFDFSSSYLDSMNHLIDLDASRKTARAAHVPTEVFFVLIVYVVTAAGVLGYAGVNKQGRGTSLFLFLLLALSLLLTIDIDRPTSGGVTESQKPMEQLRASLKAQPPEIFDRLTPKDTAPPKAVAAP